MLAELQWTYLVLLAVFVVLMASWRPFAQMIRRANQAMTEGELAVALDALMQVFHSRSPAAWLMRRMAAGQLELQIAACHLGGGRPAEALEWCRRGLSRCRALNIQIALHQIAAQASSQQGDARETTAQLSALQKLAHLSSQPVAAYHASAIGRYREVGDLSSAVGWAREMLACQTNEEVSASLYNSTVSLLESLGHFDAVFAAVEPLVLAADAGPAPGSGQALTGADIARLKSSVRELARLEPLLTALSAAEAAGRWDLHRAYLEAVRGYSGRYAALHISILGHEACAAAAAGDENAVLAAVRRMDQLLVQPGESGPAALWRHVLAGRAWGILGRHDLAVAPLRQAFATAGEPILRSRVAAQLADTLDQLGQAADAVAWRTQARRIAPDAWWNQASQGDRPVMDSGLAWLLVERLRQGKSTANLATALDAMPPVVSKLACWVWVLSIAAMVPLVGVVAGLALLVVSLILFARTPALPHDRKAATLGLGVASLSILFAGIILASMWVSAHRARAAEAALTGQAATTSPPNAPADAAAADHTEETEFLSEQDEAEAEESFEAQEDSEPVAFDSEMGATAKEQVKGVAKTVAVGTSLLVLIVSIVLHEIGHAVAAYWAGDPTARDRRRFSLNPLRHIDPFGSIVVPAFLIMAGSPSVIGWAKPVPISPHRFRNPRRGNLGVSLAGVSINIGLALLAANLLTTTLLLLKWAYPYCFLPDRWYKLSGWALVGVPQAALWQQAMQILIGFVLINAVLAAFNLLPFPPLDGFKAIQAILPGRWPQAVGKLSGMGMVVFIVLIATNLIGYLLLPGLLFAMALLAIAQGFASGF